MGTQKNDNTISIPVLPIRDRVIFPLINTPLVVGREGSIRAVKKAWGKDRLIFIVAQRNMKIEEPAKGDLFETGVIAEVLSMSQLPDGFLRIRVVGRERAKLIDLKDYDFTRVGDVVKIPSPSLEDQNPREMEALRRVAVKKFEEYAKRIGRIPNDTVGRITALTSMDKFTDTITDMLLISLEEKQDLLEIIKVPKRLTRLIEILDAEIEILQIEKKIQSRVHRQIEKSQKEYYLNEQMRAIQKELKKKDEHGQEVDEFKTKIKKLNMPKETEKMALKEAARLEKMMPYSPESTVIRTYLEWIISLPWSKATKDKIDVENAKKILNDDHFGLEKPKDRILEYLAVLKLAKSIKGPVLCFVGPPGTGKTSLVKSMADSIGRKFVRISLGGVRDESDIRGHRRTYIGSMPGRIIQALKKAGSNNPVILLDEIDKMGTDWRGDPSSALLEVLDPEQNESFVDHFLDVGFDLSKVIFIATANSSYEIPRTLLDRMEVIRFSAYTTDEKASIANQFLVNKELIEHGLPKGAIQFEEEALRKIIHLYTQEAGVRELRRKLAKICRKVAVEWVKSKPKKNKKTSIKLKDLSVYLGPAEYIREKVSPNSVGIATGLAWTEHGGETLTIEVTIMPGSGKILLTGKLGAVMQESAQAAFSLIKSKSKKLKISSKHLRKMDLHVHIPEGAVPKDGPSAGIALATAIYSCLDGIPVRNDLAMTGEVTLTGRVLAIGGLKEKILAAYREGIKTVLFPRANEKDLMEIPQNIRKNIKLISVDKIADVLKIAFRPTPPRSNPSSRKASQQPRPS